VKASDPIDRARTLLKDAAPFRWPEEEMISHVNDGQREIARRRPDSRYDQEVLTGTPADVISLDQELEISDNFITALTDWVMHRALLKDAEEADLTRSNTHYELFIRNLS
jgi:hypothetical protein